MARYWVMLVIICIGCQEAPQLAVRDIDAGNDAVCQQLAARNLGLSLVSVDHEVITLSKEKIAQAVAKPLIPDPLLETYEFSDNHEKISFRLLLKDIPICSLRIDAHLIGKDLMIMGSMPDEIPNENKIKTLTWPDQKLILEKIFMEIDDLKGQTSKLPELLNSLSLAENKVLFMNKCYDLNAQGVTPAYEVEFLIDGLPYIGVATKEKVIHAHSNYFTLDDHDHDHSIHLAQSTSNSSQSTSNSNQNTSNSNQSTSNSSQSTSNSSQSTSNSSQVESSEKSSSLTRSVQSQVYQGEEQGLALKTITIKDVSVGGSLCSDRFKTSPEDGAIPAFSLQGKFIYDESDPRFRETAVFANAMDMSSWYSRLKGGAAWNGPQIELRFDGGQAETKSKVARFLPANNIGQTPVIELGEGDGLSLKRLQIDPEVIAHEYSHFEVYNASLKSLSGESAVLHEGLADFMVFAKTGNACLAETICPKGGKTCISTQCLRSADNKLNFKTGLPVAPHLKSQIVSGLLWDILTEVGSVKATRLAYKAITLLTKDAGYQNLIDSLILADKALYTGTLCPVIIAKAHARGYAAAEDLKCQN